jgi:hypothetical protein
MDLWRGGRDGPDPLVFRERPLSVKRRADRGKTPRKQAIASFRGIDLASGCYFSAFTAFSVSVTWSLGFRFE